MGITVWGKLMLNDDVRKQVKDGLIRDEGGYHQFPYMDSRGFMTCGIGRNIQTKGISRSEADIMLDNDINDTYTQLSHDFPWINALSDVRQAVLINMAFNMGEEHLLAFTKTLGLIRLGRYNEGADEMLNSLWAKQVGNRALRLSEMMRLDKFL